MNENGWGNCRRAGGPFPELVWCYVNQPSSCGDLINSNTNPGKQLSAEACIGVNSGMKFRYIFEAYIIKDNNCLIPYF